MDKLAEQITKTGVNLHWISGHLFDLEERLFPVQEAIEGHTPPGSRPPLNTDALSLLNRGGIAGQLSGWVELIVEGRGVNPPPHRLAHLPYTESVIDLCARNLDWCAGQDWWDDFHREVRVLRHQTEHVLGLINEAPIPGDYKECVLDLVETDADSGGVCGGKLFQDFDRDVIYCRRCKTQWPQSMWLHLGLMLRTHHGETLSATRQESA